MPRIISGRAGSIPLVTPPGEKTRPTADRVKEALFSILSPRLPAEGFLDLFAGSGQIGLEAASRGCRHVVLVESAGPALRCIRQNLAKTGLQDACRLLSVDAGRAARQLAEASEHFSIIYLDPPYRDACIWFEKLATDLARLLYPDGIVVLEHDSRQEPRRIVTNLQLYRRCQYGTAMLSFYQLDHAL